MFWDTVSEKRDFNLRKKIKCCEHHKPNAIHLHCRRVEAKSAQLDTTRFK